MGQARPAKCTDYTRHVDCPRPTKYTLNLNVIVELDGDYYNNE